MWNKLQNFIRLVAHGMIYGAEVNAVGGGQYIRGALF